MRRRDTVVAGEGHSEDEQKNRENITSFISTEARYPLGRYTFEEACYHLVLRHLSAHSKNSTVTRRRLAKERPRF
jgi:hypothetical protein